MKMHQFNLAIQTHGQRLYEFTHYVDDEVVASGIVNGQITLFCCHTSASLIIQENADPDVQTDLLTFFRRLVPEGDQDFVHVLEGPDDMPAHVKAALTQISVTIPIVNGTMVLGTWQGLYLFEHRTQPHRRTIVGHVMGEGA